MKIVIATIGDYCSRTIDMYFRSIQAHADRIIFIWGCADQETEVKLMGWKNILQDRLEIVNRPFSKTDKRENGRARNAYLEILKEEHVGDFCLVMDPDEILDHGEEVRIYAARVEAGIEQQKVDGFFADVHMRHLIGALNVEDSTTDHHLAPSRFFKVTPDVHYPEVEHPILEYAQDPERQKKLGHDEARGFLLWHLAYIGFTFEIQKRYLNHKAKSNIHTPEFLDQWYRAHILNTYPRREFDPAELPDVILDEFKLSRDEFYFKNRQLELKHFTDAAHWRDHFHPRHVLEVGAGMGPRVFAMRTCGINAFGLELSKWAVEHNPFGLDREHLWQEDLLKIPVVDNCISPFDLVIAYDVLEHIDEIDIPTALEIIKSLTMKHALFSIPFTGDPNLEKDPTHKTKQSRNWWEQQIIRAGFELCEVPAHFNFRDQLIIARVTP